MAKLPGKLAKHGRLRLFLWSRRGLLQIAIRISAHGNAVVEILEMPTEAAGKQPADEQRKIAQALQPQTAFAMALRLHRLAVKQGERAQLQALFRKVEDPLAAGVLAK